MRKYKIAAVAPILLLIGCSSKPAPPLSVQTSIAPGEAPAGVPPTALPPAANPQASYPPGSYPPAATQPGTAPQGNLPEPATAAEPNFTLPEGTVIDVRLGQSLDTKTNRAGERFVTTLATPLVMDGKVVVPRGANFYGRIGESKSSGRLKGRAVMDLRLEAFDLNGRRYQIMTSKVDRVSGRHRKRNLLLIGGGAGAGASVGAIAGGPAGALIGAGAGAGAGTVGAVITGKKNVHIPVETVLHFRLREPVPL